VDILTSLVRPMIDMAAVICFFSTEDWIYNLNATCSNTVLLSEILFVLPFHCRFFQCLRMYYNTRCAFPHLLNAGKYAASILVIVLLYYKPIFEMHLGLWVWLNILATLWTYAWDLLIDWGLMRPNKNNKFLRERLMYPESWYYIAIVSNFFLRYAWVLLLIPKESLDKILPHSNQWVILLISLLELYRRAQWSLLRVENENINNFEKYRTILEIPKLPADERD